MDIYYKILNLILDIVFVVIMSVFFYEEFLFEKEKLKVKNYFKKFKNILKPILIFIASFIIVFLILLTALFIKTYAAESDTMQVSSENDVIESEAVTEIETVSLNDEELSSISDEIESILNDSTDIDKSELSDEELESTSSDGTDKPADKTIIVYQLPAQTQAALETEPETQAVIYNSIDDYVENETPALTYSEYLIIKEIKTQNVLLLFILGLEFIIMISAWRRKR